MGAMTGDVIPRKQIEEAQAARCFNRLKSDEYIPLRRLMERRLDRLLDTLKKSNDISNIRWIQGQVSVIEWFLDSIKNS